MKRFASFLRVLFGLALVGFIRKNIAGRLRRKQQVTSLQSVKRTAALVQSPSEQKIVLDISEIEIDETSIRRHHHHF